MATYKQTATYKGKTYSCIFEDVNKYMDMSFDEAFYYHGGIDESLGHRSPLYFLVFCTYDDTLVAALPMNGVNASNYDSAFEKAIEKFESASSYEKLSEYHLNRCARLEEKYSDKK